MKRHARILTGLLAALTACALLAGCGASSASNTAIAEIERGAAADAVRRRRQQLGRRRRSMTDEDTLLAPGPRPKNHLHRRPEPGKHPSSTAPAPHFWMPWPRRRRLCAEQRERRQHRIRPLGALEPSGARRPVPQLPHRSGKLRQPHLLSESTEDVTADYVDVEARLNSLEAQRQRLEELRAQAGNLEDLLAIENQLTQVQYQIESYTGQKRVLDDQITYSTVNVYLDEVKVLLPPPASAAALPARLHRGLARLRPRPAGHGRCAGGRPALLLVLGLAIAGEHSPVPPPPRRKASRRLCGPAACPPKGAAA